MSTIRSELISKNLASYITYVYDVIDNSFMRIYISFMVHLDGFLAQCKPLIGLDEWHFKLKYLGELLYANSLYYNNGHFTIAFVAVEVELKKILRNDS